MNVLHCKHIYMSVRFFDLQFVFLGELLLKII